jgi:hypothetical protein
VPLRPIAMLGVADRLDDDCSDAESATPSDASGCQPSGCHPSGCHPGGCQLIYGHVMVMDVRVAPDTVPTMRLSVPLGS